MKSHNNALSGKPMALVAGLVAATVALAGCGSDGDRATEASQDTVTVTNCGEDETFPSPAERIFVNDSNMVSMLLAIGAEDQIAAVSSMERDKDILATVYGKNIVQSLNVANKDKPTPENVIAHKPDVFFAGWNYGYDEQQNLTPDGLADRDIAAYTLSESCRQGDGSARGTMPAWQALTTDISNLGKITGRQDSAGAVVDDIKKRLDALESAPSADTSPTVLLFDSGTKEITTSGSFGGPQAIINAAGAKNTAGDIDDTWTSISWERVAAAEPDFIAFVDYPGQTFDDKVKQLRANSATKDLPAVKQERFLNLPYAMWTSGPLNIDAAELLRKNLEEASLVPDSDINPELDLD